MLTTKLAERRSINLVLLSLLSVILLGAYLVFIVKDWNTTSQIIQGLGTIGMLLLAALTLLVAIKEYYSFKDAKMQDILISYWQRYSKLVRQIPIEYLQDRRMPWNSGNVPVEVQKKGFSVVRGLLDLFCEETELFNKNRLKESTALNWFMSMQRLLMIELFQSVIQEIHKTRTWYYTRRFELLVQDMEKMAELLNQVPRGYLSDEFNFEQCDPAQAKGGERYQIGKQVLDQFFDSAEKAWQQHIEAGKKSDRVDVRWYAWKGVLRKISSYAFVQEVHRERRATRRKTAFDKELRAICEDPETH